MAASPSQIPAPRVPLVDLQTNTVSREWFMWFNNLYSFTGGGAGIVAVPNGGTGLGTTPSNGQLLIGNGTGYSLRTLFAGAGISITNGSGAISIANTGVLSVTGTGTVNGITLTGTVTSSGNLTLGGTLSGVSLTTQVSGILPVANGGTGSGVAYTVATLPTAGTQGRRAWVTNALAPTFGAAPVGGGAVVIPVFDNGTAWIVG